MSPAGTRRNHCFRAMATKVEDWVKCTNYDSYDRRESDLPK